MQTPLPAEERRSCGKINEFHISSSAIFVIKGLGPSARAQSTNAYSSELFYLIRTCVDCRCNNVLYMRGVPEEEEEGEG